MVLYRSAKYINKRDNFFNTSLWKTLLIDILIALPHPNIFCDDIYTTTSAYWNLIEVVYEINDILVVLTLCRIATLIRMIYAVSVYYSDKADRVSKMMGYHLNTFFSIKCLILKHPIRMLGVITILLITMLAIMIHIVEGPINQDYRGLYNCFWNLLVTMFTVGYGDMYPRTSLGRLIIVLCAFFGIILISLITISLQRSLALKDRERTVI